MRRGLVIVGIVLLVLGVIVAAVPMALPSSFSIPPSPSAQLQSPNVIGSGTMTIHWSGASDQTVVTIYECATSTCSNFVSQVNGSGSSGSISLSVSGGTWYAVTSTNTPSSISATATIVGITPLLLVGIILAVIGIILAVVGRRTTARPRTEPAQSAPDKWATTSAPTTSSSAPSSDPSDSHIMEAAGSPAALTVGNRPTLICNHCGAPNEPWLTNCRKCMRTLTSTGQR